MKAATVFRSIVVRMSWSGPPVRPLVLISFMLALAASCTARPLTPVAAAAGTVPSSARRTYMPYWPTGAAEPSRAIFWFGRVDETSNYADVRTIYTDAHVIVAMHVTDRILQYAADNQPPTSLAELTNWDAVSLFIDTDGNTAATLGASAHRFVSQLSYHAAYQGSGAGWIAASTPFTMTTGWRADGFNDGSLAKGWETDFYIPYRSLGLSGPPPAGTIWGLGVMLHNRNDRSAGAVVQTTAWPETFAAAAPSTWGQLVFGQPAFTPPPAAVTDVVTIRQGLNGATVMDGEVGGHTICGQKPGTDTWSGWGNANYAGYDQVNVQNEWDISDWPCFSKYFVTFPLDQVPPGRVLIAARLTMHLFGGSGGGQWGPPPDSYIQALVVDKDWDEKTLTWNNAPLAQENLGVTLVHPMGEGNIWPGTPYDFDVSRAAAAAYAAGQPLRLALYSADGAYHTGKYFSSSDTGDWNAVARPTLTVTVGLPCSGSGVTCKYSYVPLVSRSQ